MSELPSASTITPPPAATTSMGRALPTPEATAATRRACRARALGPGISVTRRRSWGSVGPPTTGTSGQQRRSVMALILPAESRARAPARPTLRHTGWGEQLQDGEHVAGSLAGDQTVWAPLRRPATMSGATASAVVAMGPSSMPSVIEVRTNPGRTTMTEAPEPDQAVAEPLGEGVEPGLGGAVDEVVGPGPLAGHRGDDHQGAVALGPELVGDGQAGRDRAGVVGDGGVGGRRRGRRRTRPGRPGRRTPR